MKPAKSADPPQPPQPPAFQRRIQIGWLQTLGISLLLLLPVGALTGWLGAEEQEISASGGALRLSALYPSRMHYKATEVLELRLENSGSQPLRGVTVVVPHDYLSHFAMLEFRPRLDRLNERGAEVDVGELPPGHSRRIAIQMQVEDYGRHAGRISATVTGGPSVALDVSTLVLP